jgi:hypothetical protein
VCEGGVAVTVVVSQAVADKLYLPRLLRRYWATLRRWYFNFVRPLRLMRLRDM